MGASNGSARALIGRERELGALVQQAQEACDGLGSTVIIHGAAGIGKSALARAVSLRGAQLGMVVCHSRSDELTRGRPFGALLEATRRLSVDDPEWASLGDRLRRVEQVDPLDAFGRVTAPLLPMVEVAADTIERQAMRRALLLVIDDLQWLDPATMATMTTLQRRIENLPLLCVLTWRTPDVERVRVVGSLVALGAGEVELQALTAEASAALADHILGAPPAASALGALARAAGNPLYLTELARAMRDRGLVSIRDGKAHASDVPLPSSLRMVLAARLARQPNEILAVLRVAAVLGTSFTLAQLATVTRRPPVELEPMVLSLAEEGVLADADDGLTFGHPLLREVLYIDLPQELRRRLHLDIASALLAAGSSPGQVAEHLLAGPQLSDEATGRLLAEAGRELIDRQPSLAVALLRRGSASLQVPAERVAVLADLVDALVADNRTNSVGPLLDEVMSAEDPIIRVRASVHRARAALGRGAFAEAQRELRVARAVPDLPVSTAARLAADDALVGVLDADPLALESARTAVALAESVSDDATVAVGLSLVGYLAMFVRQSGDAARLARAALARFDRAAPERATQLPHLLAGAVLSYTGPLELALAVVEQGRRLAEEQGQMVWAVPGFGVTAALCHLRRARLDDAEAEAYAAIRAHDELGLRVGVSWAWAEVAAVKALRGDDSAAEAALAASESMIDAVGSHVGVLWRVWVRSLLLAERDPAAALQIVAEAWTPGQEPGGIEIIAPTTVRLARRVGDAKVLRVALAELDDLEHADPTATDRAVAAWCRGLAAGDPDPILAQADALDSDERHLYAAFARQDAGELLAATGRTAEAIEVLSRASEDFDAFGATAPAEKVARVVDRLGRRTHRRLRRPSSGWGALTDTEWEVVRLAVEGLSNPDIGRRMFISRRTVETHLSHVYVKLGIASRIELVNAYLRREQVAQG